MIISLIGMSGSGKTYWAKQLSERFGYTHFYVDALIKERLEKEGILKGEDVNSTLSSWMGQPYEATYKTRSEKYLDEEREIMESIFKEIEDELNNSINVVVDTTGSVIYTGESILKNLKKCTTIVFLETPANVQLRMYEQYLKELKAVYWGDVFRKREDESNMEALARSYPLLLAYRTQIYKDLANVELDYDEVRATDFTVEDFLSKIKKSS